jgi:hypothetical protein
MPVAYRIPLPQDYRDEFDELDLRGTKQTVVECPAVCGARYSLITAEDAPPDLLAHYRDRIQVAIGACNEHPGKIVLNF